MSDEVSMGLFCGSLGLILGILIGLALGQEVGRRNERRAAVQAGAASWSCDPATGEARFGYRAAGD